jgi:predicted nucleic acid-binding protein
LAERAYCPLLPSDASTCASTRPIDDATASCFAQIADEELRAGRKLRRHDAWIAATALQHNAAVLTQDADFSAFSSVPVIRV